MLHLTSLARTDMIFLRVHYAVATIPHFRRYAAADACDLKVNHTNHKIPALYVKCGGLQEESLPREEEAVATISLFREVYCCKFLQSSLLMVAATMERST